MSARSSLLPMLALALVTALAPACATSSAVRAAERGDYASLRRLLEEDVRARRLDGGDAREVARAVATRELEGASGDEGVTRVEEVRTCARPLEDALDKKARGADLSAARAAYVLVDAGLDDPSDWADRAASEDPGFRAVGARSLVSRDRAERRRELFLDLDPRVRRGALHAAADAKDPADAPRLLETARLDPDPLARTLAARAAGEIGGREIVLALKDRWKGADDPLRATIASAWATDASYGEGGREQLLWVAETQQGAAAITAASALLRRGGDVEGVGRGALVRAIDSGTTAERVMAINLSPPSDPALLEAIVRASGTEDPAVRAAAFSKLSDVPAHRDNALAELGKLAVGSSPARNAARSALGRARDRRVVELLAANLRNPEPGVRAWAASELASMGEFPHAVSALADESPSVRTRAACALLSMPKG